jgi:flagellar basal body P-ring formation protein FlgA
MTLMRSRRSFRNFAARFGVSRLLWLGVVTWHGTVLAADSKFLPVPITIIYPGEVIKDGSLTDHDFSTDSPSSKFPAVESREAIVGKVARRTLLPGSPIPLNAIGDPKTIANGAKVRIFFEYGGLAITAYGTALQAGSVGEIILVRNLGSGITVSGAVQADGSIRVGGS